MNVSSKLLLLIGCALPLTAFATRPHVHGQAMLDVTVRDAGIAIHLSSPLDSLLGFEHAPLDIRQVRAAEAMVARLRNAKGLFVTRPEAACGLTSVRLASDVLDPALLSGGMTQPAKSTRQAGHDEHGDLDADFNFQCARPDALHGIDVRLFDAFVRLWGVDVRMVSPRGRTEQHLTRDQRMLAW